MQESFTPGPWVWVDDCLQAPNGTRDENFYNWGHGDFADDPVGAVIIETDWGYYPPREKDRLLLAAAPDMFAALCECVAFFSESKISAEVVSSCLRVIAKVNGK
jgi:hypothetical protein